MKTTILPEDSIALFDSGVGGLTIFNEVCKQLPSENVIYFGDTARVPYGSQSSQTILRYTLENASFLLRHRVKYLIVACFTCSVHALEVLEQRLSIPVIGMVQSGLEDLFEKTQTKRFAILGTESTIHSKIFELIIYKKDPFAKVFPIACPLFVSLIEKGLSHLAIEQAAHHYLDGLKSERVDAALLACTHYSLIKPTLQKVFGPSVALAESGARCVAKVKAWLTENMLLNPQKQPPAYQMYVSGDPEKFRRFIKTSLYKTHVTKLSCQTTDIL